MIKSGQDIQNIKIKSHPVVKVVKEWFSDSDCRAEAINLEF